MNLNNIVLVKKSNYNLVLQEYKNSILIFNTLQDSITLVKKKTYSNLNLSSINALHAQGVLINDEIDELQIIRHRANIQKYGGKRLHIFLTITGACNCNCRYCFAKDCYSSGIVKHEDIPYILAFIKQQLLTNRSTILNVDFFGGEPFLCENVYTILLERISLLADELGVQLECQFYTNGTIEPKSGFSFLAKYKTTLLITLDGLKNTHDNMRPLNNGKSSYESIIENLIKIKNEGCKAVIRINYGKKNYHTIPKLLDELQRLNLCSFPIEFYPIQNMSDSSSDYPDAIDLGDLVRISEYLWNEAANRGITLSLRTKSANCYCTAFTNTMFVIDPMLNVYKCALLQCSQKYSIGNLKKDTKYKRDSVFYDWLTYDPSSEKPCSNCIVLPICAGGCGGSGTFRNKTHHHSNCYDLSPIMVKKRMIQYFNQKYCDLVTSFERSEQNILIVEKAKYSEP